jgi:putative peptidoglycan lipid II flippase
VSIPAAPELAANTEQAQQEETNASVVSASSILALGNIGSRVLGLAREMVLTFLFGASAVVDAFQVATVVIRAIYDLLIGGHVNGALVPVLSEVITVQGKQELWRVVSVLMSLVLTLLTGLVLLVSLFAPQIIFVTAGGASPQTIALAIDLLRLTAPALIFMALFAVFSAALYANKRFLMPAFAGVIFNGSIVVCALILTPPYTLTSDWFTNPIGADALRPFALVRPNDAIVAVAIGWICGAVLQMLAQVWGLREARLRFTLNWRHPALRHIALLYAPVMLSLVLDTLIARPYSYNLASQTGEGSIAYMNWATTLIQFPQGLVATAISVAILPTLAGQAAALPAISRAFKDTLGLGLRLTITLILPAAAALMVLAVPIIQLLFENGAFTAEDTLITAQALRLYLIGLPFAAVDLLLVYAFYARKDTLTPTLIGVCSLLVYMLTAYVLLPVFGLYALMIADSVKHITHASISALILQRRLQGLRQLGLAPTLLKTLIAAGLMALAARLALIWLYQHLSTGTLLQEMVIVTSAGAVCVGVFTLSAYALRLEEFYRIIHLILRRKSQNHS